MKKTIGILTLSLLLIFVLGGCRMVGKVEVPDEGDAVSRQEAGTDKADADQEAGTGSVEAEQEVSGQDDNKGEEAESMTEVNEVKDMTEEELQKFASGIDTEGAGEAAGADSSGVGAGETAGAESGESAVLNNEIEVKCPSSVTVRKAGVGYGEFEHVKYDSTTCGMERGFSILLPKTYSEAEQYPVLYLLHGIFGNEFSFSSDGSNKIKEIVANMAADGLIEETIIVCPNMYAATDPAQQPGFTTEACLPYDNFINDLVKDLMPFVESHYSVKTGRENTYLAGFSMGGRETIYIALQRPELFGYVSAISAAPGIVATTDKFMTHEGQLKEEEVRFAEGAIEPEVFIICCGTRDSVVGKYPLSYHDLLDKNQTRHIWYEIPGADHDNNAIKSGLYNLFKQIAFSKNTKTE